MAGPGATVLCSDFCIYGHRAHPVVEQLPAGQRSGRRRARRSCPGTWC